MKKVHVEFINTCPCCDEYGQAIQKAADTHGGDVDVTIYYAGKDFDYLKKYGMITRGTMIINGKKKYENLSRDIIEKAISDAVKS
jgi:hypothetical protein